MNKIKQKVGQRHRGLGLLGVLLGLPGMIGTLALVTVLVSRISLDQQGGGLFVKQFMYEGLWLLFFASLFVLGASLVVSSARQVTRNVVPGPTLYVMGSSLMVIGLMMLMYDNFWQAMAAMGVGLLLMIAEWYYDIV